VSLLTDRVWLRSHEEERGAERVYRPESYPFPPARGREGLVFHADGRFEYLGPGRDDRAGGASGRWRFEPDGGDRVVAAVAGQVIDLRITQVTTDVLRLQWLAA
jgi:hypothetical protein